MFRSRLLFILLFAVCLQTTLRSQIRVMSYNLLNFPEGSIPNRIDTLGKILNYYKPHILMVQELKTAAGLQSIKNKMNSLGYGNFENAPFVSQQSAPGSVNPLQQAIIYNTEKIRFKKQHVITTSVRDINEYVLYLNDPQLAFGADTVFLYTYVTHLKSSTGSTNQQARLDMVNSWINYMTNSGIPTESNVIIAGDFNLYTNQEPAYLALLGSQNPVQMMDPLASFGNWTSSTFAHKEILTQSTRATQLANDGAGGGVDDRFDFILFSEQMLNSGNQIWMEEGSYKSLGNNGTCYNNSITACANNNEVPVDILSALYYMSDHLPQVCTLKTAMVLSNDEVTTIGNGFNLFQNAYSLQIICYSEMPSKNTVRVIDTNGKVITLTEKNASSGKNLINVDTSGLSNGIYIVQLLQNNQPIASKTFAIAR